jgi:hypothetical protein
MEYVESRHRSRRGTYAMTTKLISLAIVFAILVWIVSLNIAYER